MPAKVSVNVAACKTSLIVILSFYKAHVNINEKKIYSKEIVMMSYFIHS